MKTTQLEQIENHLLVNGKVTSWTAIKLYGITRLSHLILVLRQQKGWIIDSVWRSNAEKRWTEYQLIKYPNQ